MTRQHQQNAAKIFQFFNEIGIIHQLVGAQFARALAPDLGQSEFGVLNHFVRVGDGVAPSRLARIFQVTKPSMTAILRKLESKGYVEITAHKKDGRQKVVHITKVGRAARERGVSAIAPLAKDIGRDFDVAQLANALPTLTALREYLDTARNEQDQLTE